MNQSRRAVCLSSLCFGLAIAATVPALAHGPKPADIVTAFHEALKSGDREAALELLLPETLILESGHLQTVTEYAEHHLTSDIEMSKATSFEVLEQSMQTVEDVAWVVTRSRRTGTFKERKIDSTGVETMVLHHVKAGWRIAHIHWSSSESMVEHSVGEHHESAEHHGASSEGADSDDSHSGHQH